MNTWLELIAEKGPLEKIRRTYVTNKIEDTEVLYHRYGGNTKNTRGTDKKRRQYIPKDSSGHIYKYEGSFRIVCITDFISSQVGYKKLTYSLL